MKEYFLYKLTFPNNKVYIGQTVNFKARMRGHKNDSFNPNRMSRNCQVNNAIRKYGWDNVIKDIILTCPESEIDKEEIKHIKSLKATDRDCGYNREGGGNKNKHVSKESALLISKARKGKRTWSKPIVQMDKENNIIKKWESIASAARSLGITPSNISTMCNNKKKTQYQNGKKYEYSPKSTGGYRWSFVSLN